MLKVILCINVLCERQFWLILCVFIFKPTLKCMYATQGFLKYWIINSKTLGAHLTSWLKMPVSYFRYLSTSFWFPLDFWLLQLLA